MSAIPQNLRKPKRSGLREINQIVEVEQENVSEANKMPKKRGRNVLTKSKSRQGGDKEQSPPQSPKSKKKRLQQNNVSDKKETPEKDETKLPESKKSTGLKRQLFDEDPAQNKRVKKVKTTVSKTLSGVEPLQVTPSNSFKSEAIDANIYVNISATTSKPEAEKDETDSVFIDHVSRALGKHYFNVVDRLKLGYTPKCLTQLNACADLHSYEGNKKPKQTDDYKVQDLAAFITEGKVQHYVQSISNVLITQEFPGEKLLQLLLEVMLSVNEERQLPVARVIEEGIAIFEQTFEIFPPCWATIKQNYLDIMIKPLQMQNIDSHRYETDKGLFVLLLSMLEFNMKNDETVRDKSRQCNERRHNDMNFYLWEEINRQKYNYDANTREDGIQRVFTLLRILIRMMEMDLSVWIVRNPRNLRANLKKASKRPLIASVVWGDQDVGTGGEINFIVKRILRLFIDGSLLDYPPEDVEVLSRLVNLIAICTNLSEFNYDEEEKAVTYPYIKNNSGSFAKELKRIIDDSPHFSMSMYVKIMKNLRTPYVKMILADEIINRITNTNDHRTAIDHILRSLNKKEWTTYTLRDEAQPPNQSDITKSKETYGILPKKPTRKKVTTIYQDDFLAIQLAGFQGYIELYRIHDVFERIKVPVGQQQSQNVIQQPKFNATFNLNMMKSMNKKGLSQKINQLCHGLNQKYESEKCIFKFISIDSDMTMDYRTQIKYCYHLQKMIVKLNNRTNFFKDWFLYLKEIFNDLPEA